MTDPLRCTYEDARQVNLREGIALSTAAKVAFFEEMVTLIVSVGARDRLAEVPPAYSVAIPGVAKP